MQVTYRTKIGVSYTSTVPGAAHAIIQWNHAIWSRSATIGSRLVWEHLQCA